jgi:polyisoprenoid-binding protein YceI
VSLTLSAPVFATWSLDNEKSVLSFVSTKAIDIAEVHRFTNLAGRISDKGKAVVTVALDSVHTGIEVRDERMRELFFDTGTYANATMRTAIEMDTINDLAPGMSELLDVVLTLELHGQTMPMDVTVILSRLSETALTVTSRSPVVINAKSFGLGEGMEALRKVANLPSIGQGIPVSFMLTFESTP